MLSTVLKILALVLSLGIDTLMMSISLGFVKTSGKVKIALAFATAEAIMPLIGLFVGQGAGHVMGHYASLVGGALLLVVAVWLMFFDDDDEEEQLERRLTGWALLLTALSISLDELAVGFSIGVVGVPIALTISLIAIQAFFFTVIGLTFGARLKPYLGEWSEKLAGVVLGLLGIWILVEGIVALIHGTR